MNCYTESVFNLIRKAVKDARGANTEEEFVERFLSPVEEIKRQIEAADVWVLDSTYTYEDPKLLVRFMDNSTEIYTKYFKRKRKRKRKRGK